MSQRLSFSLVAFCVAALAVALPWVVTAYGDDPASAGGPSPAKRAGPARPANDADPFGLPAKSVHDPADPFGEGVASPPLAAQARAAAVPTKPSARIARPAARPANPANAVSLPGDESPSERKINEALLQPTQIEFVDTKLKDVFEYLRDLHHIEILLDTPALKEAGVDENVEVTLNLKGISLRSALRLMLAHIPDAKLTYAIHNEVLLITTQDKAESEEYMATKVYDVADLVTCQDSTGKLWEDYETLSDVIQDIVCTKSWCDNGGSGTIKGASLADAKILVVSQTQQVHEEIAALLKKIRAEAAKKHDTGKAGWPQRDPKKPAITLGLHQ